MIINVSMRQTIEESDMKRIELERENALDELWKTRWVNDSVFKDDFAKIEEINQLARQISGESDIIVVVSSDKNIRTIKALLSMIHSEEKAGKQNLIIWENTFSVSDYSSLFSRIEGKKTTLLAISTSKESTQLNASYSIIKKKLLGSNRNVSTGGNQVITVTNAKSITISEDAEANKYERIVISDEIDEDYSANTEVALLPLAVAGIDINSYIEGFSSTVASPKWDMDGAVFPYELAKHVYSGGGVLIETWHREYSALCRWLIASDCITDNSKTAFLPCDMNCIESDNKTFEILMTLTESREDIMTPQFENCHEDGSLAMLLEREERLCFERESARKGVSIETRYLDSENGGALIAFLQMSKAMVEFFKEGFTSSN